jgi:hypothetical protein
MCSLFIGLDLGQARDFSALVVVDRVAFVKPAVCHPAPSFMIKGGGGWTEPEKRETRHHVVHCERPRLGTPYPEIVRRVRDLLDVVGHGAELIVDATGVGRAVIDLFHERAVFPIAVTLTGGDAVTRDGSAYRVPKRDLISAVEVLLQEKRLKFAEGMANRVALVEELLSFRANVTASGHDAYGAAGARMHDDLVIALALAVWRSRATEAEPAARKPISGVSEHYENDDDPGALWLGDPAYRSLFDHGRGGSRFIGGGVGGVSLGRRGPFGSW